MDKEEALELFMSGKRGIDEWNRYRKRGVGHSKLPDLSGEVLCGIHLPGINLTSVNLQHANLEKSNLEGANLAHANLVNATLTRANLSGAKLTATKLAGADLTLAHFSSAHLFSTDLSDAVLHHSVFIQTFFQECILRRADFTNAELMFSCFADVDLSEVVGLESLNISNPSTIGIDTIYRSRGKIPEKFLRDCGVPESFMTYMGSLTGNALEYYKCFISFTEADEEFCKRLYNDLKGEGVRCWRWKEDAKWGKSLIASIDEAVRLYDKLVIILSEDSLKSEPVIREIKRALQKEQREGCEVLFPIRIDDAIFSWDHALQADVTDRHIGDFCNWNDPTKYRKSLQRLIQDLRA